MVRARTSRRRELESERWNKKLIHGFKGVPWQPAPGRRGDEITVRVSIRDTRPVEQPTELDVKQVIAG